MIQQHLVSRLLLALTTVLAAVPSYAQAPITYRVSFADAQHHRMYVAVTFPELPDGPLEVMMSRTSPGRYAMHEFAKNVYDVEIDDGSGASLPYDQPSPSQWNVTGHRGAVRVRYNVFGDLLDGTFLAVDANHAHLNMPASLMWARGLENRPARVIFEGPPEWKIATQLHPTADSRTFTAPNLQYLMDSPTELSNFTLRTFQLEQEFRVALHHDGNDAAADRFAIGLAKIVREERAVFGEFPSFERPYTFIADFLPWASSDGMEHRNSTILTASARLRNPDEHVNMLSTAAHEFFHSWNIERIRPRSLEPFKLDAPNPCSELWLAEGFTNYYEQLTMTRSGFWSLERFADRIGYVLDTVIRSRARKYRSVEDVSLLAQYTDQAAWPDVTNFDNHFVSYYDWGAAIALGLDLSLRAQSNSRTTLDDYMRRLWHEFGRPTAPTEGSVARPYTADDLRAALGEVARDRKFADDFFDRYVRGREVVDYERLLARAGLMLRKRSPGRPWIGPVSLEFDGGAPYVSNPTDEGTPAYNAGLDRDDELLSFNGIAITNPGQLDEAVQKMRPGDTARMSIRRRGDVQELTFVIGEDPGLQVVTVESTGRSLGAAERAFRQAWLASRQ